MPSVHTRRTLSFRVVCVHGRCWSAPVSKMIYFVTDIFFAALSSPVRTEEWGRYGFSFCYWHCHVTFHFHLHFLDPVWLFLYHSSPAKEKTYELATHSVKVRRSGMLSDVSALWDMGDSEALAGCALLESNRCKIQRLPSINTFNKVSLGIRSVNLGIRGLGDLE